MAQPIGVGIVGGVPLTGGLSDATTHGIDIIEHTYSKSNQYIVGAMVELRLPLGFAVEADGLYRPVNSSQTIQVVGGPMGHSSENVTTWEFPVLAKYRLPFPVVKPFVEAGPSFRTVGSSLSYFSDKGFAAGVGVELKVAKLRIAPAVRYTRWGSDSVPSPGVGFLAPSKRDQGEFLVGFSF